MPLVDSFTDADATLLEAHIPEEAFVWTLHPNSVAGGFIEGNLVECLSLFGRMWYSGNIVRVDAGGAFEATIKIEVYGPLPAQVGVWLLEDPILFTGYELLLNVFGGGPEELVGLASHSDPETSVTSVVGVSQAPALGEFDLKIRKEGDLVTGYWKGVEVVSFVNSEYPNITAIGIRYNGNDAGGHDYRILSITLPDFIPAGECYPDSSVAVVDPVVAVGFACPVDPVISPDLTASVPSHVITLDSDECITDATLVPNPEAIVLTISSEAQTCDGGLSAIHTLSELDFSDTFELSKPGCVISATDYFGDADPFFTPGDLCVGLIPPPRVDPDWLDAAIVGTTLTVSVPADPGLSQELHIVRLSITDGLTTVYAWVMWAFLF